MNKPNLFIIGAPKCGTTSLFEYLKQHPKIQTSSIKEPHYFNFNSDFRFYTSLQSYLSLFGKTSKKLYFCEASSWYYYSQETIKNILQFNPKSKIIFMVRNPVEHFFSIHKQLLFNGEEDEKNPEKAWSLQTKRRNGQKVPISCIDKNKLQYKNICALGSHLEKIKKIVPPENLHIILLEDLATRIDKTMSGLYLFLDLEPPNKTTYLRHNTSNKSRKSYFFYRMSRAIYKMKKKLNITLSFGLLNYLEKVNRKSVAGNTTKLELSNHITLCQELIKFFEKDIKIIEKELNRDLSYWSDLSFLQNSE